MLLGKFELPNRINNIYIILLDDYGIISIKYDANISCKEESTKCKYQNKICSTTTKK